MPAERIGMRDVREIIRLKFSSVSTHEIARRLNMARSTVRETLKRADGAGLSRPRTAPICATSRAGPSRSRRAARDCCKVRRREPTGLERFRVGGDLANFLHCSIGHSNRLPA
jgi:IS30 family transposase